MSETTRDDETHLDEAALDRYRRRAADPAELLAADAHLATCDRCFAAVRVDVESLQLEETHLRYEELEAFVDDRAGAIDRELVAAHTTQCERCRRELTDLAAARDALRAQKPSPYEVRVSRIRT
ncbi:MAG TPA: hypothetical protein VHW00_05915 [Thermoanaerobaculia bacterium]|nr:hypothetical protein [Thermoanaerobaculia bacterium]